MEQETIWKQKENDNRSPYGINEFKDREEKSLNAKICCVQKLAHSSFMNEERKRSDSLIPLHFPQQEHKNYCIPAVAEVAPVHCIRFSSPPLTNSGP